jgi:hypothetical protein
MGGWRAGEGYTRPELPHSQSEQCGASSLLTSTTALHGSQGRPPGLWPLASVSECPPHLSANSPASVSSAPNGCHSPNSHCASPPLTGGWTVQSLRRRVTWCATGEGLCATEESDSLRTVGWGVARREKQPMRKAFGRRLGDWGQHKQTDSKVTVLTMVPQRPTELRWSHHTQGPPLRNP